MSFQNPLLAPRSGVWVNDPRKAVGPLFSTSSINDGAAYITSTGELAATDTRIRQHRSRIAITPCARPRHPATSLCRSRCKTRGPRLCTACNYGLRPFRFFFFFGFRSRRFPRLPPSPVTHSASSPLFWPKPPLPGWKPSLGPLLAGFKFPHSFWATKGRFVSWTRLPRPSHPL